MSDRPGKDTERAHQFRSSPHGRVYRAGIAAFIMVVIAALTHAAATDTVGTDVQIAAALTGNAALLVALAARLHWRAPD